MGQGEHILLIEDDPLIATLLTDILGEAGYRTTHEATGSAGIQRAIEIRPAIILLDLMLEPDFSGLMVCRQLRELPATRDTPVIVLTAAVGSQVEAELFAAGADDFVRKGDVRPDVLVHRVEAMLRRVRKARRDVLEVGGLRLDLIGRRAHLGSERLDLTPTEFDMLARLAARPGQALDRAELLGRDETDTSTQTSANVHILALRRKLGDAAGMIETVRGEGYRMRALPPA